LAGDDKYDEYRVDRLLRNEYGLFAGGRISDTCLPDGVVGIGLAAL